MPRITRLWPVRVALLVAAWRGMSELIVRRRELEARGELAPRIAQRRAQRIEHALVRAGLRAPAREAVLVPVVADPTASSRTHGTVQVGSIHGSDVDDVGLLETAMRRTAAKPPLVTYIEDPVVHQEDAHRTDWGEMLGEENWVERAWKVVDALGALPLLALVLGVTMTFYPLVRPLDAVSPWFALGGLALVGAGALGVRWARPEEDDGDDDSDDE